MTKGHALNFAEESRIGRVSSVDTSRVVVDAENSELVTRVLVGSLVAIRGSTSFDYLIGVVDRVTRTLAEGIVEDQDEAENELTIEQTPSDAVVATLIGTYRVVEGEERDSFKRGADYFPQIDRECYFLDGPNLQRFMGLLGANLPEKQRLLLGSFAADPTAGAIANGDRLFQRHAAILGSTGSGKSWAVALLLERANALPHANIIVLDMHGEYAPLTTGDSAYASPYRIAGPGDLEAPNDGVLFLPYWLLNREEMLSMILDRSDQNAPNQASRFTLHVRQLKAATLKDESQEEALATFTVDSPIPYRIDELVRELKDDNTRKGVGAKGQPVKGDWEGKLTRFISRLEAKLEDRRYGFMFQPPKAALDYGWLASQVKQLLTAKADAPGIKVVDFSEVPSDVLPVVAGTFARLLYDIQFWVNAGKRTPYAMICDEAHLYLPIREDADAVAKQALATFERIAKEGRKYGVSLVAVSQRPSDVSRTILSQCNNFLTLRLTNDRDQSVVRRLMPDSMRGMVDALPLLDIGEALLLGDAVLIPSRIRLDKPKLPPASATRDFWTEWTSQPSDELALEQAVENLRRQTRGKE